MKVIFEHFKTLNNLIDTMDSRELNAVFINRADSLTSQKDETGRKAADQFSKVNKYSDALELMRSGYKDPLKKIKKAVVKIGRNEGYKKSQRVKSVVGSSPHIQNAILGLPKSMISRKRPVKKSKTIHLTYSFCAAAAVSPNQMIKGGINFISLVNSLEKQGIRVKIDVIFVSMVQKSATGFSVTVKEYGQSLNLLKLAFPLVHPAMLRRLSLRYLETAPGLKDNEYLYGYGAPLSSRMNDDIVKETRFLKENGMLAAKNSHYCNVYHAMQCKDVEELANIMNIVR
jgi:hypothetical protein